jgi:uncharacterized YigZ family protein
MPPAFRTPAAPATAETEVRRSRFLARLEPAETEADARAVIQAMRAAHPRARHRCTAFIVGEAPVIERSSDDGEPSGTAGRPILDVLHAAGLGRVVCVVTRYFGGVLLGTGGLARAYGDAADAAIAAARLVTMRWRDVIAVTVDYADVPAVQALAARRGWRKVAADWAERATLRLALAGEEPSEASAGLADATAGRARVVPDGTRLVADAPDR